MKQKVENQKDTGKHLLDKLSIGDVSGQSEQYHCELYDFGRKDKPCNKQCDGCKAMNID